MPLFGLFGPPNIEKLKQKRNVKGIVKALRHKEASVRANAARALGEMGITPARGLFEAAVLKLDASAEARASAMRKAFAKLDESRSVEPLVTALKDEDRVVRRAAAAALGNLANPRDKESRNLIDLLSGQGEGSVRSLYDGHVRMRILDMDTHRDLVRSAASGAEFIERYVAACGNLAMKPLVAALRDRDRDVRAAATKALERSGPDGRRAVANYRARPLRRRRAESKAEQPPIRERDDAERALAGERAVHKTRQTSASAEPRDAQLEEIKRLIWDKLSQPHVVASGMYVSWRTDVALMLEQLDFYRKYPNVSIDVAVEYALDKLQQEGRLERQLGMGDWYRARARGT